jgi:hypothetical protein
MNDLPAFGKAAKELLAKTASTVFNPSGVAKPKPKDLGAILAGIKPPDFSARPLVTPAVFSTMSGASKPNIPNLVLPDFKSLIPPIKVGKP